MKSSKVVTIVLLCLMVAGISESANAQFWRKRYNRKHKEEETSGSSTDYTDNTKTAEPVYHNRREQRRIEREERRRQRHYHHKQKDVAVEPSEKPQRKTTHVVKKAVEPEYPLSTLKARYRVDVLMPMYLDDLVKGSNVTFKDKIPDKAMPGISFYQGVTIASDSLKKAGFDLDIYIHDIGSASESVSALISNEKMDSTDLIIGAVPSKEVPALAEYAKKKQINFVSALSPADGGVRDNPYFTLIQPTLKTHCESIMAEVTKKYPGQRVSLFYRTTTEADQNAYKYLTRGVGDNDNMWQLLCDKLPQAETMAPLFDTGKPNIIIIGVLDNMYADSLLRAISTGFPAAHFEIYGMPSWNSLPNLRKADAYPNLTINITDPFDYDLKSEVGKYVSGTYKKEYGTKAPELVYRGFETMFWYANLLKKYGTIFNANYTDNSAAPFTKFEVKQQYEKNGNILFNENTHIFLSTIQGGEYKTE